MLNVTPNKSEFDDTVRLAPSSAFFQQSILKALLKVLEERSKDVNTEVSEVLASDDSENENHENLRSTGAEVSSKTEANEPESDELSGFSNANEVKENVHQNVN